MDVGLSLGGAFLSSFLNVLFDRMTPTFLDLFPGRKGEEQILKKLKRTLRVIEAVLDDAEDKHIANRHVNEWLSEVKDIVYDAEDLMDEINTEILRLKAKAGGDQGVANTVSRLSHQFLGELIPKIEVIVNDLEDLVGQAMVLGLEKCCAVKQGASSRLPSTSLVDESEVYGRDNEREKLIHMVLNENNGNGNNVSVIPVVGMGGLGKTTLAQLVYNDERIEKQFDKKAWVCVSESYDPFKITQTLVGKVVDEAMGENDDLDMLQVKLHKSLKNIRFLIVLDDVWNGNYNDWDKLKAPLKGGRQGSVILVTTRDEDVAKMMQTQDTLYVDPISHEDCWFLFKKHAFNNGLAFSSLEFERIGEKIVKKCEGLPLAVKTVGGLLRSKTEVREWNDILRSDFWSLGEKTNDILPVLRLSYHHLPPQLKHCFAFCAVFPKNYSFSEEELVSLWMANDLLQQPNQDDSLIECTEDLGHKYFCQLISRSFFQIRSGGGYLMHDLINDLARYVSGKFCARFEDHQSREISSEVRHFSYIPNDLDAFEKFKVLAQAKRLRTFFPVKLGTYDENGGQYYSNLLSKKFLSDILPGLGRLRVLSLCGYRIKDLSDSLDNLKHLRYVNLSKTHIKQLPDFICGLHNLQTLLLSDCPLLDELPEDTAELVNLRHLGLKGTKLRKMPSHMSKLRSLRTLSYFIVDNSSGRSIEELGELSLRGCLAIKGLQNVSRPDEVVKAYLRDKNRLEELALEWSGSNVDSEISRGILEKLQPNVNLKSLIIDGYDGTRFSEWLSDYSFCHIVALSLTNCMNCFILPTLGHLVSLKSLTIRGLERITRIGEEFYGDSSVIKPFASLVTLRIEEMPELLEWDTSPYVDFSCLEQLHINNCPKLKENIPPRLLSLREFEISGCGQLVCLNDWAHVVQDNQVDALSHHLSSLRRLSISDMPNLKELPEELFRFGLKYLTIQRCDSLVSFPKVMACLEKLTLNDCLSLVSLPIMASSIILRSCPKLELHGDENGDNLYDVVGNLLVEGASFNNSALDLFLKLQALTISKCESLKVFPCLQNITLLRELRIHNCDNLLCFPRGGLPAPNLEILYLNGCNRLNSLPKQMHSLLPSLLSLNIRDCPEIVCFPDGGLPSGLEKLTICSCEKLMRNTRDWGLQRLQSLRSFMIYTLEEESILDERLLPCSVKILGIYDHKNLRTMNGKGLLHLNILETLSFCNCHNLQSLLVESFPPSLKYLHIFNCPNLQSLTESPLPTSLSKLIVNECGMLKPHLERERGKYWPVVSHIPIIVLDYEVIS